MRMPLPIWEMRLTPHGIQIAKSVDSPAEPCVQSACSIAESFRALAPPPPPLTTAMGIRFACHQCGTALHIKRQLAGKRGICPTCKVKFRIPDDDAEQSIPLSAISKIAATDQADSKSSERPEQSGDTSGDQSVVHSAPDESPITGPASPAASPPPASPPPASSLTIMDDDQTAAWYVRPPAGGQYGPVDRDLLQQWIEQGRVASTSLLWRDGWPQWRAAAEALPDMIDKLQTPGAQDATLPNATPPNASPQLPTATNPTATNPAAGQLKGSRKLGVVRAKATQRRIVVIAALVAVMIVLAGVLAILLNGTA